MALSLRENICNARRLPQDHQLLVGRAELLVLEDRLLMEAVLVHGLTLVTVSRMMGMSPRRVANRVKRLSRRLTSREFLNAARALHYLSEQEAALARLRFCAGLSERKLAQKFGLSVHIVRRRLDRIRAQIAIINRVGRQRRNRPLTLPPDEGWVREAMKALEGM